MRTASWKLEQQAHDGNLTAAATGLREISGRFERAKPMMESFCRGNPGDCAT
jgi:hypothetical protein